MGGDLYFDCLYLRPRDAGQLRNNFLRGRFPQRGNIAFYVDNSNSRDALVRGYTETKVINRMVKPFWHQVGELGISAWFEITPSDFNPADAPTGAAPLPPPVRRKSKFEILGGLTHWVEFE